MADKTGFDKFVSKQVGATVQIRPKANTRPVQKTGLEMPIEVMQELQAKPAPAQETASAQSSAPVRQAPAQTTATRHPGGRPRKDPANQPKLVTINFQVDEGLKQILENLKYRTHKSTVKGVVMEAIDLLLDKYGIER